MIGIVVVSHSLALADAAVSLTAGLLPNHGVPIQVAAGADGGLGTDATAVAAALRAADDGDGVLVLCDLGSAVLAAETALEFVDPELAARIRLSPAPLVEGLVAAVATASGGADLVTVTDSAAAALTPKQTHFCAAEVPAAPPARSTAIDAEGGIEVVLSLGVPDGLHARPAARIADLVGRSDAELAVTNLRTQGPAVDGSSMLELMTLDARRGDRVRLVATGPDAAVVLGVTLALLSTPDAEN